MKRKKPVKFVIVDSAKYSADYSEAVDQFIAKYLVTVLWVNYGNVSITAESLNLSRRAVQLLIASSNINVLKIRKDSQKWLDEGDREFEDYKKYIKRG